MENTKKLGLNDYCKLAYENSKSKGFHEDEGQIDDKYTIPMRLMLIVTELAEVCEDIRENKKLNELHFDENGKPYGPASEIADVQIRLFDLCARHGVNLEEAVEKKMRYNTTRPYKHNKVI